MRHLPLVLLDEVVELHEIDVIDTEPGERALEAGPAPVAVRSPVFVGQEEFARVRAEPRREAELGLAVARRAALLSGLRELEPDRVPF